MVPRPDTPSRIGAVATALIAAGALACSGVQAELLSTYFPAGVPGFATEPGVTVRSRLRPEYEHAGSRLGSFALRPQLDQGWGYDSNVFGGANARGSWFLGSHPSLLVGSDWSRDSLVGYFGLDDWRYLNEPRQ